MGEPVLIENENEDELIVDELMNSEYTPDNGSRVARHKTKDLLNMSTDLAHYDINSIRKKPQKFSLKRLLGSRVNLVGKSLNIFTAHSKVRKFCSAISQHEIFNLFIILLILATTVLSALDSPLYDPKSDKMQVFEKINYVVTFLFTLEAVLKIITLGFVNNGPHSYIRSPWNVLDFIIVLLSIVDFAMAQTENIAVVKSLRIVRLLRPIRLVAQNGSLKTSIVSLVKSMPKILELLSLCTLVVFMFAMIETYLFSGKFYYCYTEHLDMSQVKSMQLILNKWDCLNYGGEWIKPQLNFDNIGSAMLGLSSIQSHEGWLGMMWSSVDATEVDYAPEINNMWYVFVPFTLFMIFVICLLFLNLFVGVVIETFNDQKELLSNNHLLTTSQRTYL